VPGLGHLGQLGAPDLPVARLRVAVAGSASAVTLVSVADLDPRLFTGLPPYPWTVQELDEAFDPAADPGPGDPDGTPEQFVKDTLIYGGTAVFPLGPGSPSSPVRTLVGAIPGATPVIHPARWNPPLQRLEISAHLRVRLAAAGAPAPHAPMTLDRAAQAVATFHNWPDQLAWFPKNTAFFESRYLVVAPQAYHVALQPLVDHRKARGFQVDVLALESLAPGTCADIRKAIATWHAAGNPFADHYCLLVGDVGQLPLCSSPTLPPIPGDDLYGSPADLDLDEEVLVGRLSVDSAAGAAHQVAKILAYAQDQSGQHHDEVLLAAHAQGAPGKYQAAQESVAAAAPGWDVTPAFEKLYGSAPGSTNASVRAALDAGVGFVAYRGHGTQTTWWQWNTTLQSFHKNELLLLANAQDLPVVWAFDCWNNDLAYAASGSQDCLGEAWLEVPGGGAVAHYGTSAPVATAHADELERRLFEAVFDRGLTRHAMAIAWAERLAAEVQPGPAPWASFLLGDPALRLRRKDPLPLTLVHPDTVPVCTGGGCVIKVRVLNGTSPVPGALVALHKAGPPGQPDDILVNTYTDQNGDATFPVGPTDYAAVIGVSGSDPEGNEASGSIGVVDGVWTNFGMALPGQAGGPAFMGDGPLSPLSQVLFDLDQSAANAPAGMFVSLGSDPVPFKGGTLMAAPWFLLVPLATDGQGELHLASVWPAGIPADTELWFQIAIADAVAPVGVALSNAMRAITP
jgi:hypothetical protein